MRREATPEEQALSSLMQLGAVEPAHALKALDEAGVTASDFGPSQPVASAVEALLRGGRAVDLVAVAELSHRPPADVVRISDATALWGGSQSVAQQLQAVRERSKRRQLLAALERTRSMLANPTVDLGTAISEAQSLLSAATESRGVRQLSVDLMRLIDHVEEVSKGTRAPVLATGFTELDNVIGGLQPTLTVIGAAPGVGKSALLAGLLQSLLKRGVVSGLLSLEDEGQWVVRRLIAQASQVPVFVLANRPLGAHQLELFGAAAEGMYQSLDAVLVDDRSGLTTAEVVASARAMVARGAKAVFVDHLGEIRLTRSDRHDLDIAEALRDLRALAKTYAVPVVVLCHLRRGIDAEEPKLSDFAFSAGVERMARVALALTRPKDGDAIRVHVLKQTQGVSDALVHLNFDGPSAMVTP